MKLLLDAGEDLHARPPGPMLLPSDVSEHVGKRIEAAGSGLSALFGSILNLSLNVNPSSQPGASAAELLTTQGRSHLLQELEQYLAQRRPARFAADETAGDD